MNCRSSRLRQPRQRVARLKIDSKSVVNLRHPALQDLSIAEHKHQRQRLRQPLLSGGGICSKTAPTPAMKRIFDLWVASEGLWQRTVAGGGRMLAKLDGKVNRR